MINVIFELSHVSWQAVKPGGEITLIWISHVLLDSRALYQVQWDFINYPQLYTEGYVGERPALVCLLWPFKTLS